MDFGKESARGSGRDFFRYVDSSETTTVSHCGSGSGTLNDHLVAIVTLVGVPIDLFVAGQLFESSFK